MNTGDACYGSHMPEREPQIFPEPAPRRVEWQNPNYNNNWYQTNPVAEIPLPPAPAPVAVNVYNAAPPQDVAAYIQQEIDNDFLNELRSMT